MRSLLYYFTQILHSLLSILQEFRIINHIKYNHINVVETARKGRKKIYGYF